MAMSLNKAVLVIDYFDLLYPHSKCFLNYKTDYGFLIAVMLSAQCTDQKVNKVTETLFEKYKSLNDLDKASLYEIEEIIKPLGLYKVKARNIKGITKQLINNYEGKVPSDKVEMMKLPGIGNKTSNVVRIELFDIPEFPVDTHIRRISNRLGIANTMDVLRIEDALKKTFEKNKWIKLHHQFIEFGRDICKAQSPKCMECKLKNICIYYKENNESKADK